MTQSNANQPRYLIVFNPVKNRRRRNRLGKLVRAIKASGFEWDLYPTEAGLAANRHYFDHHLADYTDLIVLGGDGTFNLVINCLQANPTIKVGLLPAGTGNDFARHWYAGKSFSQQLDIVLGEAYQPISLGACFRPITKTQPSAGQVQGLNKSQPEFDVRYFHNSLGTGFDADIAKRLSDHKSLLQSLSYTAAALRFIPRFKAPFLKILHGQTAFQYQNFVTVFANSAYFGGGLKIAPMADPKLARLELIWAESPSLLSKMKLLVKLLFGQHMQDKNVRHQPVSEKGSVVIETAKLDLQADGEYIGTSPCEIKVADFKLNLKSAT